MTPQDLFETDVFPTSNGDLSISFLGHASLLMMFNDMHIYVDPFGQVADYSKFRKADVILATHEHYDHLDPKALAFIRTQATELISNPAGAEMVGGIVMHNGDKRVVSGLQIEAVPAYNIVNKRDDGNPFHPKGKGNGYILTFSKTRIYLAGDTENIPEMENIHSIDIAFLPMNLPYTMTPEMVADAAKMIKPKILYPYHFGKTDTRKLIELLKDEKDIEVRIRKMA